MPQIGERKVWEDGDVTEWDGTGWKVIESPRLPAQSGDGDGWASPEERQGVEHPLARFARLMSDVGLPTLGGVAGGKIAGPAGAAVGTAGGKMIGDALQTIPEIPSILGNLAENPGDTLQQLGTDFGGAMGSASTMGAAAGAGEKWLGPLLQKTPTIPLKRLAQGFGAGFLFPGAAKLAGLGAGYNVAAKGAQLAGKGLEWLGTPAMGFADDAARGAVNAVPEGPALSNIQKAILRGQPEGAAVPSPEELFVINGEKQTWKSLGKDLAPRQMPNSPPSLSIQQHVQRMGLNARGANPDLNFAHLQAQIDDAMAKFLRENPGRVSVNNRVKGRLK